MFGIWSGETDVLYPGEKNKVLMGGNEYDAVDYCDVIHTNGAISIEREDGLMSPNEGLEKAIAFLKEVLIYENAGDMWWI